MVFHNGDMHRISRRQPPIPQDNLFRTLCDGPINSHDADQSVERGLDCVAAVDGDAAVQDFLVNLRVTRLWRSLTTFQAIVGCHSCGHEERQPDTWEYSSRPESRMCARSVSPLDLGEHVVDISNGIVMLCCRADDFELLADAGDRLAAAGKVQRLPNPLGDRHMA